MKATFGHINIIARDWRKLARFYETLFGCTFVPPERDYRGADVDAGTGVRNAHITGVHLRLPGLGGEHGPTLEIYSYDEFADGPAPAINRPGFAHLAFAVDDVRRAREEVLGAGGDTVGEVVTLTTKVGTKVTFCYVTDIEGNILELQSWS